MVKRQNVVSSRHRDANSFSPTSRSVRVGELAGPRAPCSRLAEANATGTPAIRPLFLEFPNDAAAIAALGEKADSVLMFGPDYLISPVTEYGATSWPVYLPKLETTGARWVHHYTNTSYVGGKSYTIDVSDLDTFPFFKRTNSTYATV